jgi:FkbM family methyltransferase
MFNRIIKELISKTGYELINKNKLTSVNLLGLKDLGIKTIIDVGANNGQFLNEYIKHFPDATYYCFEPLSEEFKELEKLAKKIGNKIIAVNRALGKEEGKIILHQHKHSSSSSILDTTDKCNELFPQTIDQKDIEVSITTLDNYFRDILDKNFKNIFLKIDVQGFELEVLKGAQATLNMVSACLLEINFTNLYRNQVRFKEIYEFMHRRGFEYAGAMDQNFKSDGRLVYSDILFTREVI